jgi:hypothetical protein
VITATINTKGVDVALSQLNRVGMVRDLATMRPLFDEIAATVYEDNRRGVMLGQDATGKPAPPLKYRNAAAIQSGARSRTSGAFGVSTRISSSRVDPVTGNPVPLIRGQAPERRNLAGKVVVLPNNNLTTAQYKRLTGPRQAPRRDQSRIITNLTSKTPVLHPWGWRLESTWADVLDAKGRKFLPRVFKTYELRGVRPWGVVRIQQLTRAYVLRLAASAP